MIKVKVSSRDSGKNLDISQYVGNDDGLWGDCQFFVNEQVSEADVWFVSEDVDDDDTSCIVPRENVVFLTAETSWAPGHYSDSPERLDVLRHFSRIYTPHDVYLPSTISAMPFLPWMINANHGESINSPHERNLTWLSELSHLDKPRVLSVFCSTQQSTPNHRMRFRFVEALKEHFGDDLDWYGNGVNPVGEKWAGIAPYAYTIVLENQSAPQVITEKLSDAFLGLAYPFYWGAENAGDYFPGNSFTPINIRDLAGSIRTIEEVISAGTRDAAFDHILVAKHRTLYENNLYSRMAAIAEKLMAVPRAPELVTLPTMASASGVAPTGQGSVLRSVGEAFNKVGDVLVRRSLND